MLQLCTKRLAELLTLHNLQASVQHLEQHGHDPRFPVNDNWSNLVDELIHHLETNTQPIWGVGHSLGGVLHYHAALLRPELYRGVVMLDSPVLTLADKMVIRAAKRFGFIDRITPAGRTLGRREEFVDLAEARNLVIVSVTLVFGIGGVLVGTGTGPDDVGLKGIALCAIVAIALNLLLPGNDSWKSKALDDHPAI